MAKNAVLSSFASGRQTSLVVDAGHDRTVGEQAEGRAVGHVCAVGECGGKGGGGTRGTTALG